MKGSLACTLLLSLVLCCTAASAKQPVTSSNTSAPSTSSSPAPSPTAYLGCYNLTQLEGVTHKRTLQPATLASCNWLCRYSNTSLTIYDGQRGCHCSGGVPSDAAKLPDAKCAIAGDASVAAVFYWHKPSNTSGCRVANVPMEPSSFDIAYNADKVSFSPDGVMTIRMDGQDGSRLTTKDGMFLYGMYEVQGLIDGHPGVVSAFYVRNSDEYNLKNSGDFDEIDVEFINGNPTQPNTLWFNSFHHGASGGELAIPPEKYAAKLGLANGTTNSNTWLRYTFDWQPDHVTWYVNGVPFERRYWGQMITWKDMKNHYATRAYRPPTSPMHVVFSMWSDLNQNRAFGGVLNFTQSPFHSSFKELRRVLCDTKPGAMGPAWVYTSPPSTPTTATPAAPTTPTSPATPAAAPAAPAAAPATPGAPATTGTPAKKPMAPTPIIPVPAKPTPTSATPVAAPPKPTPVTPSKPLTPLTPAAAKPAPVPVAASPAPSKAAPVATPAPAKPAAIPTPATKPTTPVPVAPPSPVPVKPSAVPVAPSSPVPVKPSAAPVVTPTPAKPVTGKPAPAPVATLTPAKPLPAPATAAAVTAPVPALSNANSLANSTANSTAPAATAAGAVPAVTPSSANSLNNSTGNTTAPAAAAGALPAGTLPVMAAANATAATAAIATPSPCTVQIAAYMQCGGKGGNCGTSGFGCVPTVWVGACCPVGMRCQASDVEGWYFGCNN